MTRKELQFFKKQLVQDRSLLLQAISPKMDPSPKTGDPEGGDVCDIASSDRERELRLRLSEREREKLRAIEDAIERIDDGSFGTCEECGAKIPIGRLKVMPFTTVCVPCKSREEQQRKLYAEEAEGAFVSHGTGEIGKEEEE